ncbi:MAG: universal stress protein [Methylococcales symbiont of Hymedesmia sp. n. MRB-2018]|nr:MAG: universal stress protein [Methylococcales symbiont of Hymedesmia sp. n. MRB-2018]KAF3983368.1 MAG: universal stress protein [Methylococcales symbiont of Hymedesmia sp. n. MRB-2018]
MNTMTKKVVACIDGSILTESVCDYAAWVSNKTLASVQLLHTINHHQESSMTSDLSGNIGLGSQAHLQEEITLLEQQQSKLKLQQGKLMLEAAKQRIQQSGINAPICTQRHGDLIESLITLEEDIRVLVLGLRGHVHADQPHQIGAKLESIIRSLHLPILVINSAFKTPKRFMIAYDGSKVANKVIKMIAASPLFRNMSCHLVCVNNDEKTASKLLEQAVNTLKPVDGLDLTSSQLKGNVVQELCAYQQQYDIDLTIMGAFSHIRIHDMLLGSFTHKMLVNANKPLLLLR